MCKFENWQMPAAPSSPEMGEFENLQMLRRS